MVSISDYEYAHKSTCNSKYSSNTERRNEVYDKGIGCVVEYDVYCKECGRYLYHFCYGHYEV